MQSVRHRHGFTMVLSPGKTLHGVLVAKATSIAMVKRQGLTRPPPTRLARPFRPRHSPVLSRLKTAQNVCRPFSYRPYCLRLGYINYAVQPPEPLSKTTPRNSDRPLGLDFWPCELQPQHWIQSATPSDLSSAFLASLSPVRIGPTRLATRPSRSPPMSHKPSFHHNGARISRFRSDTDRNRVRALEIPAHIFAISFFPAVLTRSRRATTRCKCLQACYKRTPVDLGLLSLYYKRRAWQECRQPSAACILWLCIVFCSWRRIHRNYLDDDHAAFLSSPTRRNIFHDDARYSTSTIRRRIFDTAGH